MIVAPSVVSVKGQCLIPVATFGTKHFTIIDSLGEASLLCAIDNN